MTRPYVQKAVAVVTLAPFLGLLRQRLEPVTEALFLQRDFRDQEMLSQFARQLQNQDASAQPEADLYEGIDALHGRLLGCRGCIRFLYVKLQDSEHTQNTLALNMQHFQRHRSSKLIVEYDANVIE